MAYTIQETEKHRREIMVNKLIAFHLYEKNDPRLEVLSITEMEREYRRFLSASHPHDGFGSLRIRWRKK